MGHRLSKIYTRTGDKGSTGLGDGSRIEKDDLRIEAIGTVDELNSCVGMVLALSMPDEVRDCLEDVQHDLFDLGGELSIPGHEKLAGDDISRLESRLESFNSELPMLKEFILPGGGQAAAACHLARAVCRRAERRTVSLAREQDINPHAVAYLNRLSDLLFVIARTLAHFEQGKEVLWQPDRHHQK